eukprot:1420920-Amphidinium_carterae.1
MGLLRIIAHFRSPPHHITLHHTTPLKRSSTSTTANTPEICQHSPRNQILPPLSDINRSLLHITPVRHNLTT